MKLQKLFESRRGNGLLLLVWFLVQLPFVSSAFRIDEPYYIWVAQHISRSPLDPYSVTINWYGTPERAFEALPNPPLVPYWLAFWHSLFPSTEISLHLSALVLSLFALHGFQVIADSLGVNPLSATLLIICSPGFYLGSQVTMLDTPMLALLLLALGYALVYEQTGKPSALVIAGISGFLCPLAKYGGVLLVPLIACLALKSKRRSAMLLIATLPVVSLLLWNLFTWFMYGSFHLSAVRHFLDQHGQKGPVLLIALGILARFGLGVIPLALTIPMTRKRQLGLRQALLDLIIFFGVFCLGHELGFGWLPSLLFAVSVTLSVHAFSITIIAGYRSFLKDDAIQQLLFVWIVAGLILQFTMPFTSVRYLVPLGPPLVLLVLTISRWPGVNRSFLIACVANLLFLTSLAIGDSGIANDYRRIVNDEIAPLLRVEHKKGKFYFSGHWGFQYYAEQIGGQAIDKYRQPEYKPGDLIVIAESASADISEPDLLNGQTVSLRTTTLEPDWPIRTIAPSALANFYTDWTFGTRFPTLLPFGFSWKPTESLKFYTVQEPRSSGNP